MGPGIRDELGCSLVDEFAQKSERASGFPTRGAGERVVSPEASDARGRLSITAGVWAPGQSATSSVVRGATAPQAGAGPASLATPALSAAGSCRDGIAPETGVLSENVCYTGSRDVDVFIPSTGTEDPRGTRGHEAKRLLRQKGPGSCLDVRGGAAEGGWADAGTAEPSGWGRGRTRLQS